ncbi:MAG: ABC transporter ATP-binding protein/permease [Phycisphaerales bacterium]|nr:ABC transporter ATP-binding protein/permease [Phycisphaerales bacterium]
MAHMRDLWPFMRMMFKYPGRLVGAVAASLVGAACLGAGLGGMMVILQHILGKDGKNLPQLMEGLNKTLDRSAAARGLGLHVPEGWIAGLPTRPYDAVVWTVAALGVATLIGSVANYLHSYHSLTVAGWTLRDLRQRVFGHVVALPMKTVVERGPSALVSQVVYDTGQVWSGYVALLQKVVAQTLKGTAGLVMAVYFDWRISLGGIAVGMVLGSILRSLGTKIRRAARRGLEAQGELQRTANEAVTHMRIVKSNNAEERERERFSQANASFLRQDMKVRRGKSLASPLVELLGLVALGVMATITAKAILDGAVEPDRFLMALTSLGLAAGCLKPLTGIYNELQVTTAASQRLAALLALEREDAHESGRPALGVHRESIRLESVTLTYPGASAPALDGVSLTIRHGETVAIVGPNGSGKTTLLSLLPRILEPDTGAGGVRRGRVLIDGVDIAGVSLESLRKQIGVVTQETALFKGTVWWNIAYGAEGLVSDERVRAAARKARAEEFVLAKPGGYQFVIGEHGSGLSGGQRQRLCIARAVLRDPAILILDEATSMVDADSERQIADALAEFARGRTCLIVAHRLSTVVHADRIVVMNHGRIEDVGTHRELLSRSETYRLIASHQLMKAEEGPQEAGGDARPTVEAGRSDA